MHCFHLVSLLVSHHDRMWARNYNSGSQETSHGGGGELKRGESYPLTMFTISQTDDNLNKTGLKHVEDRLVTGAREPRGQIKGHKVRGPSPTSRPPYFFIFYITYIVITDETLGKAPQCFSKNLKVMLLFCLCPSVSPKLNNIRFILIQDKRKTMENKH